MRSYVLAAVALVLVVAGCESSRKPSGNGRTNTTAVPEPVAMDAGISAAPAPAVPKPAVLTRPPADVAQGVVLQRMVRGLKRPVQIVDAPGDAPGRLFVVEQGGRILLLVDGAIADAPFADLSNLVTRRGNEQGLLGLAFHPKFATNRLLYVNYTAKRGGDTLVVERKAASGFAIDPDHERVLLTVEQPYSNHNAGDLQFGPDGKLYVGFGDGGAAGDPGNRSQDDSSYLGKMLRIDVDTPKPVIDVVAKGLRNPWRYSFDRETGDLYIGDVGQNLWEWVVVAPAGDLGTKELNFGWNITEGLHCFRPKSGCDRTGITPPAIEYDHNTGCSLTGGFVYRGAALPKLRGHYFYADYCTGVLRSFRWQDGVVTALWDWKPVLDPDSKLAALSSFGQDADGELYLVSLDGVIWKFAVE